MKVEFEVRDDFAKDGRPVFGKLTMEKLLADFARTMLDAMDETIYNVKIDGEDVSVY